MSEKNFVAYGDAETVLTGFATDIKTKQPKTLETPITIEGVQKTTVESALQGLVGSVADGKALVASAITNKGVSTSANASFSTMANNIAQIPSAPSSYYPNKFYLSAYKAPTGVTSNRYTIYLSDIAPYIANFSHVKVTLTLVENNILDEYPITISLYDSGAEVGPIGTFNKNTAIGTAITRSQNSSIGAITLRLERGGYGTEVYRIAFNILVENY